MRAGSLMSPYSFFVMAGRRRAEATPFFERLCPAMTAACDARAHAIITF
jgi:hypothetical protein